MSEPTRTASTKALGMLLQDPAVRDEAGEPLHTDLPFLLDRDYLVGTGSSKFLIRDANEQDVPLFDSPDWSDSTTALSYADFNTDPRNRNLVDNVAFHQVNAFAVASHTLGFFEEAVGHEVSWPSGGPLVIRPHAFEGMNAYYDPQNPSLNFGYFASPFRPQTVWTCLSHDVVSHELGHAVLDSVRPLWMYSSELDTPALHESLGDLLALFSALEHPAVVARMFAECGGDMFRPSVLTGLAEEFGIGIRGSGSAFLRSALQGGSYGPDAPKEAHDRSTIWTAAVYLLLADLVDTLVPNDPTTRRDRFDDFAAAVRTAAGRCRRMLLRALASTPPSGVTMPMLARLVYAADERLFPDDPQSREIAQQVFWKRGLWDDSLVLDAPGIGKQLSDFESLGVAARGALVARNATALRIPVGVGTRPLTPSLTTAVREVDATKQGVARSAVTERYLHYAHEIIALTQVDGPDGPVDVGISTYSGGTLVLDETGDDVLLATDPALVAEDADSTDPAARAFQCKVDRFSDTHRRALRALRAGTAPGRDAQRGIVYDDPACPFLVRAGDTGAARFLRRRCDIAEHLRRTAYPRSGVALPDAITRRLSP